MNRTGYVPQPTTSLCIYPSTPIESPEPVPTAEDGTPGHATIRLPGLSLLFTGPEPGDDLVALDTMRAALDALRDRLQGADR